MEKDGNANGDMDDDSEVVARSANTNNETPEDSKQKEKRTSPPSVSSPSSSSARQGEQNGFGLPLLVVILVLLVALLVFLVVVVFVPRGGRSNSNSISNNNNNNSSILSPTENGTTIGDDSSSPSKGIPEVPKKKNMGGFHHGVASGSPLPNAIILWTRYTPEFNKDKDEEEEEEVTIEYRIAKIPPSHENSRDSRDLAWLLGTQEEQEEEQRGQSQIRHGWVTTSADRDWTIQVDITGLESKTRYVYVFVDGNQATSPVGMTKTAPHPNDPMTQEKLRFALFSCSNFRTGYFHAYNVARRMNPPLDFWIHVGDYIYEAAANPENDERPGVQPLHESVTLQDYRLRYQSYHGDVALQKLRATAPLLVTWDDHEFADNAHPLGSRKHKDETEGVWSQRVEAGMQAFFEWMPIRRSPQNKAEETMTQVFHFGSLATLFSCDTRLFHRTASAANAGDPIREFGVLYPQSSSHSSYNLSAFRDESTSIHRKLKKTARKIIQRQYDPSSRIMGSEMINTMSNVFNESSRIHGRPWQILAVPVMMAHNIWPPFDRIWEFAPPSLQSTLKLRLMEYLSQDVTSWTAGRYRSTIPLQEFQICQAMDDWCGAAHERRNILHALANTTTNALVLGGDLHTSWAATLYQSGNASGSRPVGVNIGAPSVTSGGEERGLREVLRPLIASSSVSWRNWTRVFHEAWYGFNPGMAYADVVHRGFVAVELNHQTASMEFIHMTTVKRRYDRFSTRQDVFCGLSLRSNAQQPGSLYPVGGWQYDGNETCPVFSLDLRQENSTTPELWNETVSPAFMGHS